MRKYKGTITKGFLIREYIDNKKSLSTISLAVGCGMRLVKYYLNKYNIKIRTLSDVNKLIKKSHKEILSKDYLFNEYLVNKKSANDIAKEVGFSSSTVINYLTEHNIKIRSKSEAMKITDRKGLTHFNKYNNILTKDFLIKEYIVNEKSLGKIATVIGTDSQTISNYLKKHNIKSRNNSEANLIRFQDPNERKKAGLSGKSHHNYKTGNYEKGRLCPLCGEVISPGATICVNCYIEWTKNERDYKGEKNPNYNGGWDNNLPNCLDCGKKLANPDGLRCKEHWYKFYKEEGLIKGDKNPMFGKENKWGHHTEETKRILSLSKGGTGIPYENSEYGSDFDDILKELVRSRDNYECQLCGKSQLDNGRQLDCHHIDYDKMNNPSFNLIALCRNCHPKTNADRKYWTKYFKQKIKEIYNGT